MSFYNICVFLQNVFVCFSQRSVFLSHLPDNTFPWKNANISASEDSKILESVDAITSLWFLSDIDLNYMWWSSPCSVSFQPHSPWTPALLVHTAKSENVLLWTILNLFLCLRSPLILNMCCCFLIYKKKDRRPRTCALLLSSSSQLLLHCWCRESFVFYRHFWSQHSCSISPLFLLILYHQPLLTHWLLSCILCIRSPGVVGEWPQTCFFFLKWLPVPSCTFKKGIVFLWTGIPQNLTDPWVYGNLVAFPKVNNYYGLMVSPQNVSAEACYL